MIDLQFFVLFAYIWSKLDCQVSKISWNSEDLVNAERSSVSKIVSRKRGPKNWCTAVEVYYEITKSFSWSLTTMRALWIVMCWYERLMIKKASSKMLKSARNSYFFLRRVSPKFRTVRNIYYVIGKSLLAERVRSSGNLDPHTKKKSSNKLTTIVSNLSKIARHTSFVGRKKHQSLANHNQNLMIDREDSLR